MLVGGALVVALSVGGFFLSESGSDASVQAVGSGEHTSVVIGPSGTDTIAPEEAVAIFDEEMKAVVDYAKAQDDAKQAYTDLVNAKIAQDAADKAAAQKQQATEVTSNSNPGDFLSCVRNRESRGNYGIYNSSGSGAAGAYQFLPSTWNSIAASSGRGDLVGVDPAQASPADQDAMARALYAQQGAAPWGGSCG